MILCRRIALCVIVLMLGVTGVVAQDDKSWITYIVDNQIYKMRPDGTDSHLLTDFTALTMQWSSDGEWFLIASTEGLAEDLAVMGYEHLFRVDADGSDIQQITTEPILNLSHISLSPDGIWIVYTACPDGYMHDCQLYKIRSDGTDFAHITDSPGYNQYLSWSPDSESILLSAYDGQRRNIYRMNADGVQVELVTEGWSMAWSPDGEWIAFIVDYAVYRMRPDGSEVEQLTQGFNVLETISWSPDSAWILFEIRHENTIDLYRMRADGSEQERLVTLGGMNAVSSPAGEWILFRVREFGNFDLYRIRADGSDLQRLTETPELERDAQWQP